MQIPHYFVRLTHPEHLLTELVMMSIVISYGVNTTEIAYFLLYPLSHKQNSTHTHLSLKFIIPLMENSTAITVGINKV